MPLARIGERDAQARDRHAAETDRGIEHRSDFDATESQPRRSADDARAHRHDRGVGTDDVTRDRQRAVNGYRFVVAAERVTARDGRVEQPAVAQ